jgi:hypothetical protein
MSCSSSWTGELPPKAVNGCFVLYPVECTSELLHKDLTYLTSLPTLLPYMQCLISKWKQATFAFCIQPNLVSLCTIESNVKVALEDHSQNATLDLAIIIGPHFGNAPTPRLYPHTLKDLIKRLIIQLANFTLYYHSTFAASTHVCRMIN